MPCLASCHAWEVSGSSQCTLWICLWLYCNPRCSGPSLTWWSSVSPLLSSQLLLWMHVCLFVWTFVHVDRCECMCVPAMLVASKMSSTDVKAVLPKGAGCSMSPLSAMLCLNFSWFLPLHIILEHTDLLLSSIMPSHSLSYCFILTKCECFSRLCKKKRILRAYICYLCL